MAEKEFEVKEKSFVVKLEKDGHCHQLKLLGNWFNAYMLKAGTTSGITFCGIMGEGKLVQEPVDCPKCLEKESR